jgi:GNAT superfamily N-acetyltransferase
MEPSRFRFERLATHHNRPAFESEDPELDHYFRHLARQDVRRRLTTVYVMDDADSGLVVGFYTLSAASVPADHLPEEVTRSLPHYKEFPALLIGRLAIDHRYQGMGRGGELLSAALRLAFQTTDHVGAAFVLVDAKNDLVQRFYERYSFAPILGDGLRLFLPMRSVANLIGVSR